MDVLTEIPWFAWIPIVAIVCGVASSTIQCVVKASYRHRERMEMIRMGMHPDTVQTSAAHPYEKPLPVEDI